MKPRIIISHPLPVNWITDLENGFEVLIGPDNSPGLSEELVKKLPTADGVLCLLCDSITDEMIQTGKKLKVVSNMAAGVDNIDLISCTRNKIPVGYAPDVVTEATADLTMALILSLSRNLTQAAGDALAGNWFMWHPAKWLGIDLKGATLGIIGMGKIGKAVTRRARAFGLEVVYFSRKRNDDIEKETGAVFTNLDQLLMNSDIVSIHTPLSGETRGMIGYDQIGMMKHGSILINTARGQIVDQEALYDALTSRKILAAGLDVTSPEPLPPNHKLFSLSNCLILPHIGSATSQTRKKLAELAVQNLISGLKGEKLLFCANPRVYL
jgi:glyoxylate reductase